MSNLGGSLRLQNWQAKNVWAMETGDSSNY